MFSNAKDATEAARAARIRGDSALSASFEALSRQLARSEELKRRYGVK